MKQLLSLALALIPCLAWAQYPSNGNQKITLGEQTTADGLIWRGVASDTTKTVKTDTSAWIVLDTASSIMYHYDSSSVGRKWLRVGGTISSDMTGTLPVANGGTNTTTLTANKVMVGNGTSGVLTPTNLHWDNTNSRLGIGSSSPTTTLTVNGTITSVMGNNSLLFNSASATTGFQYLTLSNSGAGFTLGIERSTGGALSNGSTAYATVIQTSNSTNLQFGTNNNIRATFDGSGNLGLGTSTPQSGYRLHVVDSVYVGGNVSASAYTTRSDYNLKDDIFNLKYGLNEILNLQPVEYTYKSNGSKQLGFIAQDIGTILPEVVSFEESMSVNYQAIIPVLTKAIQEQQALIKALEQRIINLENK